MYVYKSSEKTKISDFFWKYFFHFFDLVYGKNMF